MRTDLIERDRNIDPTPFLLTFLAGTDHSDGSVSAVHDLYKAFTGDGVGSIQQWITPELTELLADLVSYVSVEIGRTQLSLEGRFSRIRDIFIPDVPVEAGPSTARTRRPGIFRRDEPGTTDAVLEATQAVEWTTARNDGHAAGLLV